jgi:hypothetical protein
MDSAFRRGVALLKESESDAGQHHGPPGQGPIPATKSIGKVPKDVMLLKPVIGKLMDKVDLIVRSASADETQDLPKGLDERWFLKAKESADFLRKFQSKKLERLEEILVNLEEDINLVDSLIEN